MHWFASDQHNHFIPVNGSELPSARQGIADFVDLFLTVLFADDGQSLIGRNIGDDTAQGQLSVFHKILEILWRWSFPIRDGLLSE